MEENNKDSVEHGAAKEVSICSVVTESEEESSFRLFMTFKERLQKVLHSHKFQVAVIGLVILDCLLVVAELMLDLKLLELHEKHNPVPHVLHYMSIGILSIFIIEIMAKVYAFGFDFFRHKLEVFDAFVVFLSFALDVAFREEETVANGFGLVIILRLWRVARILNGVVMSVKTQSERKLLKERKLRESVEEELSKCKDYSSALEKEVETLRAILRQHGIKEIPESVVEPKESNTIDVVAEVNYTQLT